MAIMSISWVMEKIGKNSHWNWLISVKHIENQKIMEKIHLQEKFPFSMDGICNVV